MPDRIKLHLVSRFVRVQKFRKSLLLFHLLAPLGTYGLGIGDIHVQSGLNQNIVAEIPLVLSGSDSLNDIRVNLARPEEFAKLGLNRDFFLTKLQFKPVLRPDGRYAILVTSREAVREPMLTFLMEVNWPKGRTLREYTVLLDPPDNRSNYGDSRRKPAFEQPNNDYSDVEPGDVNRIAEIERSQSYYPERQRRRHLDTVPSRDTRSPNWNRMEKPGSLPPNREQLTGETYGPVRYDQNLSGIAKNIGQGTDLTLEQVAMALYHANRKAFGGNINTLRAGARLRIPTVDYMAQLSPEEAGQEFARHQGWRGQPRITPIRSGEPSRQDLAADTPGNQLRLLSASESRDQRDMPTAGNSRGRAGGSRNRSDLGLEVSETLKQENEEFRSRLAQLEQRIVDMQHLLSLKEEQIGMLQSRQQAATEPKAPNVIPESGQSDQTNTPPVKGPNSPQSPAASVQAANTPGLTAKGQEPAKPRTPTPVLPPPLVSEGENSGIMQFIEENPSLLQTLGGLAVLGLGTGLLLHRRRNTSEEMLSQFDGGKSSATDTYPETDRDNPSSSDESKRFQRPASNLDRPAAYLNNNSGIEDEIDPISEADIFLAYGRVQQALERMRKAIVLEPQRSDLRFKLLEIFQHEGNRKSFDEYVDELKLQKNDFEPGFWNAVSALRAQLPPGDDKIEEDFESLLSSPAPEKADSVTPLNSGVDHHVASRIETPSAPVSDTARIELEMDQLRTDSKPSAAENAPSKPDLTSEVHLEDLAEEKKSDLADKYEDKRNTDAEHLIAFDLDQLFSEKGKPELDLNPAGKVEAKPASFETPPEWLEFNPSELQTAEVPEVQEPEKIPDDHLISFTIDGKGASNGQLAQEPKVHEKNSDHSADELLKELTEQLYKETDDVDVELSIDELDSAQEAIINPLGDGTGIVSRRSLVKDEFDKSILDDLTDRDPIETQLDLAKAYADMGDMDSALEILRDVVSKGNQKQREEAGELLYQLGRITPFETDS